MSSDGSPRLTVCLTFDFDAMSVWINTVKSNNPTEIARGEYGAYVIPRILAMLAEADIRATLVATQLSKKSSSNALSKKASNLVVKMLRTS